MKTKSRNTFLGRIMVFLLLAETLGSGQTTPATETDLKPRPQQDARVSVPLAVNGEGYREVSLHAETPQSGTNFYRFYHKPLFALRERAHDGEVPTWAATKKWIWSVDEHKGGATVKLKVSFSAPVWRRYFQRVLTDKLPAVEPRSIEVLRWPLTALIIECRSSTSRDAKVLGTYWSGPLEGSPDDVPVELVVLPENWREFLDGVKSDKLWLTYRYTYVGAEVKSAAVRLRGIIDIKARANFDLGAEKVAGTSPIFEQDVVKIVSSIGSQIRREIVTDAPELIVRLQEPSIQAKLFDPANTLTLDSLYKQQYKEPDAELVKYLTPLFRDVHDTKQDNEETKHTTEAKDQSTVKIAANFGLGKGGSLTPSFDTTTEDLDRVEKTSGVTFTQNASTKEFAVQSVRVYRMREGSQTISLDDQAAIFVSDRKETSFYTEAAVSTALIYENMQAIPICSVCDGKGNILCAECKGTGHLECAKCRGKGLLLRKEKQTVLIAAKCPTCGGEPFRSTMSIRPEEIRGLESNHGADWDKLRAARKYQYVGSIAQPEFWIEKWRETLNEIDCYCLENGAYVTRKSVLLQKLLCPACQGAAYTVSPSTREAETVTHCDQAGCQNGVVRCEHSINGSRCNGGLIRCAQCLGIGVNEDLGRSREL